MILSKQIFYTLISELMKIYVCETKTQFFILILRRILLNLLIRYYLSFAGSACSNNLISSTFPFNEAAFSTAAAATATSLDAEQAQTHAARHAQASAQANVHIVAALFTP